MSHYVQPALRISRIFSYKTNFEKHLVDMKLWFQVRGYPSNLVKKQTKKSFKGIHLVFTFLSLLKDMGNIIRKNLHSLYIKTKAQNDFMPELIITFRSPRKFRSYLVRAKLYPLEQTVGSMVNDVKFMTMLQKHRPSLAPWLVHTK